MPQDVFSQVESIEAEAERIARQADDERRAVEAEAAARIDRLDYEADQAHDQRLGEAKQHSAALLREETDRANTAHQALLQRLETIRTGRIDSLADWLIERLLDADREH